MRAEIVIDEQLMRECLEATGLRTEREVVELALRALLTTKRQAAIKPYFGKLKWEGHLDEMRTNA